MRITELNELDNSFQDGTSNPNDETEDEKKSEPMPPTGSIICREKYRRKLTVQTKKALKAAADAIKYDEHLEINP
ncbi:hypothetical protein JTB14_010699 [Gonioctena quinquepunctata]|nr:hypothetical protein JTB14_010699 [Gonioctena quinquepunctata]